MSKPDSMPVPNPEEQRRQQADRPHSEPQEPLSGSKKVKQRNHSRQNNGEG